MRQRFNHKKGFSLVEAAIVLGVVGLVIGGIWWAASAVTERFEVMQAEKDLLHICSKGTSVFPRNLSRQGTGFINATTAAISAGVFPDNWIKNGSAKSTFGGRVDLFIYDQGRMNGSENIGGVIQLRMYDLNESQCINFLSYINSKSGAFIRYIFVGDNVNVLSNAQYYFPYSGNMTDSCLDGVPTRLDILCSTK